MLGIWIGGLIQLLCAYVTLPLYALVTQEVVVQGQDKVFKDVIEPLESVSVNMIPTKKQDIRDLGSLQEVFRIHMVAAVPLSFF